MRAHLLVAAAFAPLFFFSIRANAEDGVVVETNLPPPPPPTQAQSEATPPPPAPYQRTTKGTPGAYSDDDDDEGADPSIPKARTGFQMSVRGGYSIPMGTAGGGLKMSDAFGSQVPVIVDIGGKVHPNIFVGGYLGLAFGGCGDQLSHTGGCLTDSFTIGVEALFSILPRGRVNPWVGYGIGLAASALAANGETASFGGFDFGHFMGGVDFRVSRGFGVGPFVDLGVGEYTSISETLNGQTISGSVNDKTIHEWLTFGAKFTIFP